MTSMRPVGETEVDRAHQTGGPENKPRVPLQDERERSAQHFDRTRDGGTHEYTSLRPPDAASPFTSVLFNDQLARPLVVDRCRRLSAVLVRQTRSAVKEVRRAALWSSSE